MILRILISLLTFVVCFVCNADEIKSGTDIDFNKDSFPWDLVIDRGKINGCIYKNTFFSEGSILIEETLPRKCKINAARDGFWAELDEREIELFGESVKSQQKLEAESTKIEGEPINQFEATVIRAIRRQEQKKF